MFDAGASPRHVQDFFSLLDVRGARRPDFVSVSHWHWDHSFGMCAINAPVIASRATDEELKVMTRWKWDDTSMRARVASGEDILFSYDMMNREYTNCELIHVQRADIVFQGTLSIDLGGITCELSHIGGPHSADSVICYVPEESFVFLGDSNGKDMMGSKWEYDPAHPEKLEETLASLPYDSIRLDTYVEKLQRLDFTRCLGGHSNPMTRNKLFEMLEVQPASRCHKKFSGGKKQ
jgi:glyoxylase-like metal-dependent hydrolase (beta-lactamase superfamily II)